jgi:hypothetical protein
MSDEVGYLEADERGGDPSRYVLNVWRRLIGVIA